MNGAPNITGRNAKLWCAREPQGTLTENAGAPTPSAELWEGPDGYAKEGPGNPAPLQEKLMQLTGARL